MENKKTLALCKGLLYNVSMKLEIRGRNGTYPNTSITVQEAARILDVSLDTIRRWDKKGLIKADRSDKNHRIFKPANDTKRNR